MADRKVLNKYYPPDYDISKIPRLRLSKNRQIPSRIMLPMSVQCLQCGEFIYKGKKFNARKEYCEGEDYLTVKKWRFYFRCPSCLAEITFKTDPQHSDYTVEHGATRNVEAWKIKRDQLERQRLERQQDDLDIMKKLENKTDDSKREMEIHEVIEELRERNSKGQFFNTQQLVNIHIHRKQQQEEKADEEIAKAVFQQKQKSSSLTSTAATSVSSASSPLSNITQQHSSSSFSISSFSSDPVESHLDFELVDGESLDAGDLHVNESDQIDEIDDDKIDPELRAERRQLRDIGLSFAASQSKSESQQNVSSIPLTAPTVLIKVKKRKQQPIIHDSHKKHKDQHANSNAVEAVASPGSTNAVGNSDGGSGLSSLLGGYESDSD